MSNLWKALRDVSRDADPTIGFEPLLQGSERAGAPPTDGNLPAQRPVPMAGHEPAGAGQHHGPDQHPSYDQHPSHDQPSSYDQPSSHDQHPSYDETGGSDQGAGHDQPGPRELPTLLSPQSSLSRPRPVTRPKAVAAPTAPPQPAPGVLRNRLADVLNASPTVPYQDDSRPAPAPVSPANLPRALRAFAPGTPDTSQMAVLVGAPQWHHGDDDVMPQDGRRTARPRLRDRFGF